MTKTLTEELKYLRELEPYLGPSELLLKLILKLEARVDELEKLAGKEAGLMRRINSLEFKLADFELERERGVGAVEAEDYSDCQCGSCNRELTEDEIIEMELENGYGSDT